MIPGLNPKKMQAMMKQLGIKSEDIEAERVIIEKSDNAGRIIIENPSITKINVQGQDQFQISGDVREEAGEESETEEESPEDLEQDIQTIIEKTGKTDKEEVALCLEKNNGDIVKTILELSE